jgi:hypothetical protein
MIEHYTFFGEKLKKYINPYEDAPSTTIYYTQLGKKNITFLLGYNIIVCMSGILMFDFTSNIKLFNSNSSLIYEKVINQQGYNFEIKSYTKDDCLVYNKKLEKYYNKQLKLFLDHYRSKYEITRMLT